MHVIASTDRRFSVVNAFAESDFALKFFLKGAFENKGAAFKSFCSDTFS